MVMGIGQFTKAINANHMGVKCNFKCKLLSSYKIQHNVIKRIGTFGIDRNDLMGHFMIQASFYMYLWH